MSPSPDYQLSELSEFSYASGLRPADDAARAKRQTATSSRFRRNSRPKSFNGIHRRKIKRINW